MSKERQLLQRILNGDNRGDFFISNELFEQIKELLAQPENEQEPVAWFYDYDGTTWVKLKKPDLPNMHHSVTNIIPLYTSPPKRGGITPREGLTEYKKGYARAELDLKREPLIELEIYRMYENAEYLGFLAYKKGIKDAEKAHGIGVVDE